MKILYFPGLYHIKQSHYQFLGVWTSVYRRGYKLFRVTRGCRLLRKNRSTNDRCMCGKSTAITTQGTNCTCECAETPRHHHTGHELYLWMCGNSQASPHREQTVHVDALDSLGSDRRDWWLRVLLVTGLLAAFKSGRFLNYFRKNSLKFCVPEFFDSFFLCAWFLRVL